MVIVPSQCSTSRFLLINSIYTLNFCGDANANFDKFSELLVQKKIACKEESRRSSLQWNNCLCTFWPYSKSFMALFANISNFDEAVIRMFNCLSINKEHLLCYSKDNRLLLAKSVRHYLDDLCPIWSQAAIFEFQKYRRCLRVNQIDIPDCG